MLKDDSTDSINAKVFRFQNDNIHISEKLVELSELVCVCFLPCVYSLHIFPGEKRQR